MISEYVDLEKLDNEKMAELLNDDDNNFESEEDLDQPVEVVSFDDKNPK